MAANRKISVDYDNQQNCFLSPLERLKTKTFYERFFAVRLFRRLKYYWTWSVAWIRGSVTDKKKPIWSFSSKQVEAKGIEKRRSSLLWNSSHGFSFTPLMNSFYLFVLILSLSSSHTHSLSLYLPLVIYLSISILFPVSLSGSHSLGMFFTGIYFFSVENTKKEKSK